MFGLLLQRFPFEEEGIGGRSGECITLSGRSKSDSFVIGSSLENCDCPKLCTIAEVFVSEIEFAYTTDKPFNNSNSAIAIGNEDSKFFTMADTPYIHKRLIIFRHIVICSISVGNRRSIYYSRTFIFQ